jgi:DNA-binding response OmpR family regulator
MKPLTGNVLYIEDDEDARELVKDAMAMNNYKVIAASN